MKCLFFGTILLTLFSFPLQGQAEATLPGFPEEGSAPLSTQEFRVTSQGIFIQARDRPLGEVLQRIHNKSGIRFSSPSALMATPITITIKAPDWPAAVMRLLQDFNKVIVWDEAQHLSHVILLQSAGGQDVSPPKERSVAADRSRTPEASIGASHPTPFLPSPPAWQGLTNDSPPPADYTYPDKAGPPMRDSGTDGSPPPVKTGPGVNSQAPPPETR